MSDPELPRDRGWLTVAPIGPATVRHSHFTSVAATVRHSPPQSWLEINNCEEIMETVSILGNLR